MEEVFACLQENTFSSYNAGMGQVLLIHPEIKERNDIASRLRSNDFEVECAMGGFHALNLLEKHPYDIMLIIGDMEDMAANEIIMLTRNAKSKEELPILYSSQNVTQKEIIEAFEIGANDFLAKTDQFNLLLEKIKKLKRFVKR